MLDQASDHDLVEEPDLSHLITEDDEPVDNPFSERQQKLLGDCLEASYDPGEPFICLANVGLFHQAENNPLVPDCLLSLGVTAPEDIWEKGNRAYMIWRYGKPPDLVVEVVSNRKGNEDTDKLRMYERMRVSYYVIFDPTGMLSKRELRLYELRGTRLIELIDPLAPLEQLGLKLTLWEGEYAQVEGRYLRWLDLEDNLLLTGKELALKEKGRADEAQHRADEEQRRADQEKHRADRLAEQTRKMAEKLRELGVEPEEL